MCYDKAMDQFFTSTGHERFVDCRKLNQTKGKAGAIEGLLKEIEAEKVERAACEASVRKCIESVETSCMKVSPCAGCGCMATGLVVSDLSRGGFECLRVNPENEESMQQELAMLAACQCHLAKQCFPMWRLLAPCTNTTGGCTTWIVLGEAAGRCKCAWGAQRHAKTMGQCPMFGHRTWWLVGQISGLRVF